MNAAESYAASLPGTCVAHLQDESAALGALNQCLADIGQALKEHDTEELVRLVESQQVRMQQIAALRERRRLVRKLIAADRAIVEDDVSILEWADTLPEPDRSRVLEQRNRLMQLVEESTRLASNNMAVVQNGLLVLQQVMESLTGQETASDRYTASGNIRSLSMHQSKMTGRE